MILAVSIKFLVLCLVDGLLLSGVVILGQESARVFCGIESSILNRQNVWLKGVIPVVVLLIPGIPLLIYLLRDIEFFLMRS